MKLDEESRDWIGKNLPFFSPEVKAQALERLKVCQGCPRLTPKINRCEECGCLMPAKVFFKGASCPLGKWEKMKVDNGREK